MCACVTETRFGPTVIDRNRTSHARKTETFATAAARRKPSRATVFAAKRNETGEILREQVIRRIYRDRSSRITLQYIITPLSGRRITRVAVIGSLSATGHRVIQTLHNSFRFLVVCVYNKYIVFGVRKANAQRSARDTRTPTALSPRAVRARRDGVLRARCAFKTFISTLGGRSFRSRSSELRRCGERHDAPGSNPGKTYGTAAQQAFRTGWERFSSGRLIKSMFVDQLFATRRRGEE